MMEARTMLMRSLLATAMLASCGLPAPVKQGSPARRTDWARMFGFGWFGRLECWRERQQWQ
jgi:hypothetical protein